MSEDFRLLERELDFLWDYLLDNCLFIVPKDNSWVDYISKISMPPRLREKTFRYIRRIIDSNRWIITNSVVDNDNWYDWGIKMLVEYGLNYIVAPQKQRVLNNGNNEQIIDFPINPSQYALVQMKASKCQIIQTTEEDFERTLKPVLEYARILRVIDPYINTKPWSRSSVEIASQLLGYSLKKEHSYKCRFEIYISEGKAEKSGLTKKQARESRELMIAWEPMWKVVRYYGHSFKVVVLGNENNQKELHDRFILTDQCGIMLSTGFSCDKPSHPQVWMMIPERAFRTITDMFVLNSPYPIRSQFQFE